LLFHPKWVKKSFTKTIPKVLCLAIPTIRMKGSRKSAEDVHPAATKVAARVEAAAKARSGSTYATQVDSMDDSFVSPYLRTAL
jgi:hypothetical protein